jgi:hypothetical protein
LKLRGQYKEDEINEGRKLRISSKNENEIKEWEYKRINKTRGERIHNED